MLVQVFVSFMAEIYFYWVEEFSFIDSYQWKLPLSTYSTRQNSSPVPFARRSLEKNIRPHRKQKRVVKTNAHAVCGAHVKSYFCILLSN